MNLIRDERVFNADIDAVRRYIREPEVAAAINETVLEIHRSCAISDTYLVLKRITDIFVSIIGLILFFPIFIPLAIWIKLDSPGPVIYSQERIGKNGKPFTCYKLRTMVYGAEEKTGPIWASKEDERVTRAGRFLRQFRLDEFPQFISVLKGDMSVVGPRPERPALIERFSEEIPYFPLRLMVYPGLTGLAQISGGYDLTPEEKLRYDLIYIKDRSILLDLVIIIKTIFVVFFGKGAR